MPLLKPDRFFVSVLDITPELLAAAGVKGLILDLDNTLLPRTEHTVPANLAAWVSEVQAAGIKCVCLSNNWHERVVDTAASLGLDFVGKAVKPLPHGFIIARRRLGLRRREVAVVGDQVFTDILGAHLGGLRGFMVLPLVKQDLWHTLLLRHVEHFITRNMVPEGGERAFVCEDDEAPALL